MCGMGVCVVIISKTLSKVQLRKRLTHNPLLSLYSKAIHSHETRSLLFIVVFVDLTSDYLRF